MPLEEPQEVGGEEYDDDSDASSKEALDLFLGGIDSNLLKETDWNEEMLVIEHPLPEKDEKKEEAPPPKNISISTLGPPDASTEKLWKELLTRTHAVCPSSGALQEPSVRIVDLSHLGKGFGLVATKRFEKGQVVFTEQAAVASQIPQYRSTHTTDPWTNDLFPVRACQQCFRSMEPISSLSGLGAGELPSPHLWPVPEYSTTATEDITTQLQTDSNSGAMQCRHCRALFCNRFCHKLHLEQFGSCCTVTNAVKTVLDWCHTSRISTEQSDQEVPIQEPLVLASRLFVRILQRHRQNQDGALHSTTMEETNMLHCFTGLCGEPEDITPLEIGELQGQEYSIQSLYSRLCDVLMVSQQEQESLSSSLLQQLAANAARNGHNMATQNPFRPYYNALLRQVGRGSEQHTNLKHQVAHALGSTDGQLQRDMDPLVEHNCCVQPIVAIFPLTARNNHSCNPNAMVRNQEYVDCYMDVVAKRPIEIGEEITTSYLPSGLRRNRRQRELAAKYLFQCQCELCSCG